MKKLMKKKVSLLGKEFSVFAIMLVGMMVFSSAALVGYLSNSVSGDAVVQSPISMSLTEEKMAVHGGEVADLTVTVTNQADVNITGVVENLVTSASEEYDGITYYMDCDDFESVFAQTISTYPVNVVAPERVAGTDGNGANGCSLTSGTVLGTDVRVYTCTEYDLIAAGLCHVISENLVDPTVIQFGYGPNSGTTNEVTYMPGQVDVTTIKATFKPNALGTYVFSSQVVA